MGGFEDGSIISGVAAGVPSGIAAAAVWTSRISARLQSVENALLRLDKQLSAITVIRVKERD